MLARAGPPICPRAKAKPLSNRNALPVTAPTGLQRRKKTKDAWQDTVDRMVSKGAGLSSKEYDQLIEYLVKNFLKEEPAKLDKAAPADHKR